MKLIEQAILIFRKGRSEKVYEVDLCEVGEGRYVVNFRYGRRGGTLKDGTKTVAPVNEAAAREAYDQLVSSKRQQGYAEGPAHAVGARVSKDRGETWSDPTILVNLEDRMGAEGIDCGYEGNL